MSRTKPLKLTAGEREELEQLTRERSAKAGHVRRARAILLAADGVSGVEIGRRLSVSVPQISRIRKRFERGHVPGLGDQPKASRKDHAVTPQQVERIVSLVMSPPPKGYSRWSTRQIGDRVKLTSSTAARVLRANDLKPHLARTFKVSRDPNFVAKVHDVVGLYLNPPENAVVLSVDEKTQIQALERNGERTSPLRFAEVVEYVGRSRARGVRHNRAVNVARSVPRSTELPA